MGKPQHIIHMIIGGTDDPQGPVIKRTKLFAATEGQTRSCMPEDILAFSEEDLETLSHPHNDALVISFLLNNVQVKHVLVDPGSSANVIRSKVVEQLGLLNQIIPTSRVLNGFNMVGEATKREITLPVNMSDIVRNTKFHVIEGDMRYNSLLERSWIHNMRAVPSTLHQMMKFPTKDGIKTVYGEHHVAKKMFAVHEEVPTSIPSASKERVDKETLEDDEEDFFTPRSFIAPEESDATKLIIEELEQAVLIKHLPDRKVYLEWD
ncbi:uncharacterized protein LOC142166998 [Nicotiana tabacum]|uniref:Uncharacterized protein LOC142166998 n=1 Tax=Nicotiana tabacum TaxID=4097 RepID=A0AC58SE39_TOBAC